MKVHTWLRLVVSVVNSVINEIASLTQQSRITITSVFKRCTLKSI